MIRRGQKLSKCWKLTDPLPFADPAVVRFAGPDHPLEVGARAVVDIVAVVPQVEERLAVLASVRLPLLQGLKGISKIGKSKKFKFGTYGRE